MVTTVVKSGVPVRVKAGVKAGVDRKGMAEGKGVDLGGGRSGKKGKRTVERRGEQINESSKIKRSKCTHLIYISLIAMSLLINE